MARVPYVQRTDLPPDKQFVYDRLEREFSPPIGNIFLALGNTPDILDAVVTMALALRRTIIIERRFRELAILAVGLATKSKYEYEHHRNEAIALGLSREQIDAIPEFETSALFDPTERAVLRFAFEITEAGVVSQSTWTELQRHFDVRQAMEIQMVTAWYNCVARILLPLEIELEDNFVRL